MPNPKRVDDDFGALSRRPYAREFVALTHQIAAMREQLSRLTDMQGAVHQSVTKGFSRLDEMSLEMASIACLSSSKCACQPLTVPIAQFANCDPNSASAAPAIAVVEKAKMPQIGVGVPTSQGETHQPKMASRSTSSLCELQTKLQSTSFSACDASEHDQRDLLKGIFEIDQLQQEAKAAQDHLRKHHMEYWYSVATNMSRTDWDIALCSCMGFIIAANCIFIGFSMDMDTEDEPAWRVAEMSFTFVFMAELALKFWIHGASFLCGPGYISNWYDAALVALDVWQLGLAFANADLPGVPSASLFRLIRLLKLARFVRLLNSAIFTDLMCMLQGMLGGLSTLGWAMFFFLIVVYAISLLGREVLGRKDVPEVSSMFDSVPRAMLTTFRCSFGDCTTAMGTPVFEHVNKAYGGGLTFLYCVTTFMVTVGLFNVISAIFVERTMKAASDLHQAQKSSRMKDDVLWCTCVATLVKRLMHFSGHEVPERLADAMSEILALDVPAEVVEELAQDPESVEALEKLDIDRLDHTRLIGILDPDNGGTIRVVELMDGIKRLRGDFRRSDIVTIDMMIRSVQRDLAVIKGAVCGASSS